MDNKLKSVTAMLISALSFSLMALFVKLIEDISVFQKAIFRTGTILIVSSIFMYFKKIKIRSIENHKLLLARSIFGAVGVVLNYYAIDHLVLSDANVIFRLSTIFLIIFSWIFLKEKISFTQTITIIIAFIGVVFIIKPELSFKLIPFMVAIGGAAFAAMAYTTLRVLGKKEHPITIVFYFSAFGTIALLPYVIYNYETMDFIQIIYALLAGVFAGIGQVGVTVAYKYAPAREVSIYNYVGVVFSALFSIVIFDMIPDMMSVAGYIIVFISSYYMYIKNREITAV